MMKTLLEYGHEAMSTQLTTQLFYKDVAEQNSDLESSNVTGSINGGMSSRASYIADSKVLTMSGPIYEVNWYLLNEVDLTLKMYRSDPKFCLMSNVTEHEFKVQILAHNELFVKSNALYPYTKTKVKVTSIPTSQQTHSIDNVSNPVANRYIVGLVESASLNGSYSGNPFNFKSSMLKKVTLYVDGVSVPSQPTEADDVESYVNMLDGMDLWKKDKGNAITRSDFLLGSALFVFDLDKMCEDSEYLNLVKSGTVRLELEFKSALINPLSCVVLTQRNSLIEIDQATCSSNEQADDSSDKGYLPETNVRTGRTEEEEEDDDSQSDSESKSSDTSTSSDSE
ncbi:uncharacterized protein F54H12.2-like [Haliotis cracherodii]|uniref:uncharacterized protein F54H12.2-like n=1 Tax=Haliotis cracherodii TaxID=6455 RepID=UPI0039E91C74